MRSKRLDGMAITLLLLLMTLLLLLFTSAAYAENEYPRAPNYANTLVFQDVNRYTKSL